MIAVIAEPRDGTVHRGSLEAIAAASQLASRPPIVVLAGTGLEHALSALAQIETGGIFLLEQSIAGHEARAVVTRLTDWIREAGPELVLAAHTYWARDVIPRVAARLRCPLISDCTAIRNGEGRRLFTRPLFRGKLTADVAVEGPWPHLATLQIGAFSSDSVQSSTESAPVTRLLTTRAADDSAGIADPPFQESTPSIDLSRAEKIVAAGRGIQDAKQLELVGRLATAIGAEVAASRPLCDAGWLPLDRQVGSSGQTVAPRLYVALGISGAIQHIVGMKGAKTIVAINKDSQAPIFEIADYAIVGDLNDILPALITALADD